jgi:hypothetical protein
VQPPAGTTNAEAMEAGERVPYDVRVRVVVQATVVGARETMRAEDNVIDIRQPLASSR